MTRKGLHDLLRSEILDPEKVLEVFKFHANQGLDTLAQYIMVIVEKTTMTEEQLKQLDSYLDIAAQKWRHDFKDPFVADEYEHGRIYVAEKLQELEKLEKDKT